MEAPRRSQHRGRIASLLFRYINKLPKKVFEIDSVSFKTSGRCRFHVANWTRRCRLEQQRFVKGPDDSRMAQCIAGCSAQQDGIGANPTSALTRYSGVVCGTNSRNRMIALDRTAPDPDPSGRVDIHSYKVTLAAYIYSNCPWLNSPTFDL